MNNEEIAREIKYQVDEYDLPELEAATNVADMLGITQAEVIDAFYAGGRGNR